MVPVLCQPIQPGRQKEGQNYNVLDMNEAETSFKRLLIAQ